MAKTPKLPKKEEEYKFSEIDEEPIIEPEKRSRSPIPAILRNRKILLVTGVIVAVFIVYQFIGRTPKVEQEITQLEGQLQPLTSIAPAEPTTTTTTVTTTPEISTATVTPVSAIQNGLNDNVTNLNGGVNQTQNQAPLQQIQGNIQQLQSSVAQIGNQVSNLTATVGALPQACFPPKIVQPAVVAPRIKKVVVAPRPIYAVRAVVPGRAWLQVKKNRHILHLITVKVGDFLPGYGRVQAINDRQGKVWTSWGNVINYDNGVTD